VMLDPAADYAALYRCAKLLDKHPVRASIPVVPGFSKAVRVAVALAFAVKLEIGQPPPPVVAELAEVVELFLHRASVQQPIEFLPGAFLALYHGIETTLWAIQEEDPALVRFVTEDGREVLARRFVAGVAADGARTLVSRVAERALAGEGECASCPYFGT